MIFAAFHTILNITCSEKYLTDVTYRHYKQNIIAVNKRSFNLFHNSFAPQNYRFSLFCRRHSSFMAHLLDLDVCCSEFDLSSDSEQKIRGGDLEVSLTTKTSVLLSCSMLQRTGIKVSRLFLANRIRRIQFSDKSTKKMWKKRQRK